MNDIDVYVQLALVIVLMGTGRVIKSIDVFSKIPNDTIPGILIVIGVLLSMIFNGLTLDAAATGVISALVSVGIHQTGKTGTSLFTNWAKLDK